MLELKNVCKRYSTGTFEQTALDAVSIAFRDNEFVAILGPSGSGKTTMLNVIGGLDRFDSGDLLVDDVSTKEFKERDWDAYRNNRIGFVFQSYNLIPHQSVLSNVELALTLSGVPRGKRRRRALEALEEVGLKDHADKRPSQLSGGQMQRVAIARALVNNPEILLADEPTGALDSSTSVQVMDLLKEVARDRLVIMVTHNPELAHEYATRIVELADGCITADSNPFDVSVASRRKAKPTHRTSMSFLTALSLSFNNLMTKKGRTLMTAFAGSIGIIGIAAILALANGTNEYIRRVEEDMLSIYPLTITEQSVNLTSAMASMSTASASSQKSGAADQADQQDDTTTPENQSLEGTVSSSKYLEKMTTSIGKNDLKALKDFIDNNGGDIKSYTSAVTYQYNVKPHLYLPAGADSTSGDPVQVNPDQTYSRISPNVPAYSPMAQFSSTSSFAQLPSDPSIYESRYTVRAGRWPKAWNEVVLVLRPNGTISDYVEYSMGLRDYADVRKIVDQVADGSNVTVSESDKTYTYNQLMSPTFKLVNAADLYAWDAGLGVWKDMSNDQTYVNNLVEKAPDIKIVGVVQAKDPSAQGGLNHGLYYTPELEQRLIAAAADSEIVKDQQNRSDIDVFTGKTFADEKNGATEGLSLSSLISVDETALASAFSMNPQALDFSNIDLSGINLSEMDFSEVNLPELDPASLNLNSDDLLAAMPDGFDPSVLQKAFPELSADDIRQVLSGIRINFKLGGQAALSQAIREIVLGWNTWRTANPGKTIADYLATDEVRAKMISAVSAAIDTDDLQKQLVAALSEKLGTAADVPSLKKEVAERIMKAYQEQIASALSQAITKAISAYMQQAMASVMTQVSSRLQIRIASALSQTMQSVIATMSGAMHVDPEALKSAFKLNADPAQIAAIAASMISSQSATYDSNLAKMGYADLDTPSSINIYPKDFAGKEKVVEILERYNADAREAGEDGKVITYTDLVGVLMSSVTQIIDMISAMLVAFVSISLVVSSIMIGIITYISVLERKKEIGILRSIGASRRDIANVFNAETFIEGLISGVMGILLTFLLIIPANIAVKQMFAVENLVVLPWNAALILIGISVVLTLLAGLLPARRASKSDPVEALRSE